MKTEPSYNFQHTLRVDQVIPPNSTPPKKGVLKRLA